MNKCPLFMATGKMAVDCVGKNCAWYYTVCGQLDSNTTADLIRNMPDEKLAKYLKKISEEGRNYHFDYDDWLNFLKQEPK